MRNLIKYIRDVKNITKTSMIRDGFTDYYYNKLENNCEEATLYDLKIILNKFGIELDEFIYLYQREYNLKQYNRSYNKNIIKNEELRKKLYDAVYYINNNQFDIAQNKLKEIWDSISENNDYFATDLFLLSHCFIIFSPDNNNFYIKLLEDNFPFWREYNDFIRIEINFYLNIGRYMLEHDPYNKDVIKYYKKAYKLSQEYNIGDLTGVSLIRLGAYKNDKNLIEDGKKLLSIFNKKLLDIECEDLKI